MRTWSVVAQVLTMSLPMSLTLTPMEYWGFASPAKSSSPKSSDWETSPWNSESIATERFWAKRSHLTSVRFKGLLICQASNFKVNAIPNLLG